MKKNKIILLTLSTLLFSIPAFSQTTGSNDNYKPPTTTLTPAATGNTGASGSGGSGTVGGDSRVQYFYRTRNDTTCPTGMTGQMVYTQKYYIRPDGSMFEEPWYLTQNNCTRTVDDSFTPGQTQDTANIISSTATNLNNMMATMGLTGNQAQQVQSLISSSGGAKGTWTTRSFIYNYNLNGDKASALVTCVVGYGENPRILVKRPGGYAPPGIAEDKPYPEWVGGPDPNYPNYDTGGVCPAGSGINYLTLPLVYKPDVGGDPGTE